MLPDLVAIQREIYLQVAEIIKAFASGSGWASLMIMLPAGIAFGAVHALPPGHSKAVLATYVAGSRIGLTKAVFVSFCLSATHVTIAVFIAIFALPLILRTHAFTRETLEFAVIIRGFLSLIGALIWWRSVSYPYPFPYLPRPN
tara:strand:+ start:381 stop:812 length:432 start_codon:yes stop_codon:yes gene_type:complete